MKRFALLISTIVLCFLFFKLLINYSDRFSKLSKTVVLASHTEHSEMVSVLKTINAIDESDAEFIATQIEHKREKFSLNSLSDFNERAWQISCSAINSSGSKGFKKRLEVSKRQLGQDDEYEQLKDNHYNKFEKNGDGTILVKIYEKEEDKGLVSKIFRKPEKPCDGITVRLSEHYIDSLNTAVRKTLAWAKTDSFGIVEFSGLDVNKSYSVLPIANGFEYGSPKGTTKGSLAESSKNGSAVYSFIQQEHKIRMFDAKALAQIKEQHILTVRSFEKYKSILTLYLILFFAVWLGFSLLWYCRHKKSDNSIIAVLMFLTGLCVLVMFSINDPLEDTLLGAEMAKGVIAGVVVMGLIQFVDFTKLYQNRARIGFDIPFECISWLFKPFRKKISYQTQILSDKRYTVLKKIMALLVILLCLPFLLLDLIIGKLPKGCGYLITALLLTALLWSPFGSEVGGMKVNLNLFGIKFQPSEIAKYLIIFFMAAFFSVNANKIMKYSAKGNVELFGHKLKMLSAITIGLGILMVMYLVLGDMGPALVLAFTFIILYSIVKSKVDLENLDERNQNIKILTCDLAMLAYGVISFIVFLYIGNMFGGELSMLVFCVLWFALWIILGLSKKQLFESAILFNLIISAFIFGGTLLNNIPISKLNEIGERLESRTEMCTNTWGTLPIDGAVADAGENTQVAEGLWGLASGGLWGQGLGNGSPNFIPAFHTDMILETIGEQLGFIGVFVVILLLSLLLRKTILIGYKASHPFAFYLCLGISIVTAVQFIIISLGSTGIIPLTGVTVPFLSKGRVSMILNLAAFGVILSYDTVTNKNTVAVHSATGNNLKQYNYSVSVLSWLYCGIAVLICCVFFHYQFTDRNMTLIKPVYVHNADGAPVVEYNPRIAQLINKMWAGDIYDRNGVLLATSDAMKIEKYASVYEEINTRIGENEPKLGCNTQIPQKRYYPFGNYLTFMLGKYGSDIAAFRSENSGYVAEYRHMSELRGYDNKKYIVKDGKKTPLKVDLGSDEFKPGRFVGPTLDSVKNLQIRDYSALIPYLKAGYNSSRVEKMNSRKEPFWSIGTIKPHDLQLTIDAQLQTKIQRELIDYVTYNDRNYIKDNNLLRISVIVLNAENGDLLASANYPMVDYNRLDTLPDKFMYNDYRDYSVDKTWTAFVDRDLGLTLPTAPGSTAKIMSSIAGLRKLGRDKVKSIEYFDNNNENRKEVKDRKTGRIIIQEGVVGSEDSKHLKDQMVSMKKAVVWSSNNYFIKLVNENDLYNDLAYLYGQVGVRIGRDGYPRQSAQTYGMIYPNEIKTDSLYKYVRRESAVAVAAYERYKERRKENGVSWIHPLSDHTAWQWAYGQGTLDATPLTIARVVSIVGNAGNMPKTRYLRTDDKPDVIPIIDKCDADELLSYMDIEAMEHMKNVSFKKTDRVSGKTGTAQRTFGNSKMKDGWYACIIKDCPVSKSGMINRDGDFVETEPSVEAFTLAVVVRIERIGKGSSADAKGLVRNRLLNILKPSKGE